MQIDNWEVSHDAFGELIKRDLSGVYSNSIFTKLTEFEIVLVEYILKSKRKGRGRMSGCDEHRDAVPNCEECYDDLLSDIKYFRELVAKLENENKRIWNLEEEIRNHRCDDNKRKFVQA